MNIRKPFILNWERQCALNVPCVLTYMDQTFMDSVLNLDCNVVRIYYGKQTTIVLNNASDATLKYQ